MRGPPHSPLVRALFPALLVLAAVPLALHLYGLGAGGTFYYHLARHPLAPAEHAPYYRESLLHVGLAHLLGLTTTITGFRVFVLSFFYLGLAVFLFATTRRLPIASTLLIALVLVTHPTAMIAHAWTCHPDALLYFLTALLLFVRRPPLRALLAALAAWTNLPMAILVCISLALLDHARTARDARPRTIAVLLGLLAGALTLERTLHLHGIHLATDRFTAAAAHDAATLLGYWTAPGPAVLYTLHFAHLLWLPALLLTLRDHHPRLVRPLIATQLLALAAAFLAEDTTRVFAFLAWPPLLATTILALRHHDDRHHLRPLILLAVLITLLAPKQFAWKGHLHDLEPARTHLRALLE